MKSRIFSVSMALFFGLATVAIAQPAEENQTPEAPATVEKTVDAPAKPVADKPKPKPEKKELPANISSWNFKEINIAESGWKFPDEKAVSTPNGIIYRQKGQLKLGPIHNNLNFKADPNQTVKVTLAVYGDDTGKMEVKKIKAVQLFWATKDDVKAAEGKWAFSKDRVKNLTHVSGGIWTGKLYFKSWKGQIARLFINPVLEGYPDGKIPDGATVEFLIERIEIE